MDMDHQLGEGRHGTADVFCNLDGKRILARGTSPTCKFQCDRFKDGAVRVEGFFGLFSGTRCICVAR